MRVALVTCRALPGGNPDDRPVAEALGADVVAWDDPEVPWDGYDRVVLRSAWNYTRHRDAFLAWARERGAALRNAQPVVEWNSDKRYLRDLADAGIPTVPTTFVAPGDPVPAGATAGEVVVKPSISAGARDTGRFADPAATRALVERITAGGRTAMIQPYLTGVDERGETAVVFLRGEVSHVLRKRAVLRPDEVAPLTTEHPLEAAAAMFDPGLVVAGEATEAELALARRMVGRLGDPPPLFARIDLVPGPDGAPVVLEVEAVEPHLYLATAPGAAERFAAAIAAS